MTQGHRVGLAIVQGGCCAICGLERALIVDHSHASGLVRGLLCVTRNAAIAILDNPRWLSQALRYLTRASVRAVRPGVGPLGRRREERP
jgi:hypothetical protein